MAPVALPSDAAARAAVVGLSGPVLLADEAALLRAALPVGVILFARNIQDPVQLRHLVASVRDLGAAVLVDQEGGRVARLRPPHWPAFAAAAAHDTPDAVRDTGAAIGQACAALGIGVVCAPVLDLRWPGGHDVIGDRAYGADSAHVAAMGRAMADGLLSAGVLPVAKHAPGHGRAEADSHLALPVVRGDLAQDIAPFQALHDLPWMMTAHILYPDIDPDWPATLSSRLIGTVIRGMIGFPGVLVSDDLAMQALRGTPGERAARAIVAGCDVAMHCSGVLEDSAAVLEAAGRLTPLAAARLAAGWSLVA